MKAFFAALRFLTIVPLPEKWTGGEKGLERSVPFFPVVGLLIGIAAALFDRLAGGILPPFPTSVLVIIVLIGSSGGLHMDGLADTADGFFSARPRETILQIMHDSRIGAMGVTAIVCVTALKIALVGSVPCDLRWKALFLMPLAGRCTLVLLITAMPYARPEGGLATVFRRRRSWLNALWAAALLALAGWFGAEWKGLLAGLSSVAAMILFGIYTYRKIGGFTGDTLGAGCELIEIVPVMVFSILA
ncbi:MAG: adenosylcobinamide-GDP ribazoletransferase [Syntrophales bacterium]